MKTLSSPSRSSSSGPQRSSLVKMLLYLTLMAFFVATFVVIATPVMSNEKAHNAIFGSFDSTGAAIILVGFPYLVLQYLRHHQGM